MYWLLCGGVPTNYHDTCGDRTGIFTIKFCILWSILRDGFLTWIQFAEENSPLSHLNCFVETNVDKKMLWKIWTMRTLILFALMSMFCALAKVAAVQQCGPGLNLTLNVERGETVMLPCTLQTILLKKQRIIWRTGSGDSQVECTITPRICTYYRPHDPRFHIVTDYEKEFKLNITNVQADDTYHCGLYKDSLGTCEASKVTLNVTEKHVSPVIHDLSTVSIISSSAISERFTKNLPNEYSSTPIAVKHHGTFIFLTIFIATLLILMLFSAVCCCLLVNKFEIHLRQETMAAEVLTLMKVICLKWNLWAK